MTLPVPQPNVLGDPTHRIDSKTWPQILEHLSVVCPRAA